MSNVGPASKDRHFYCVSLSLLFTHTKPARLARRLYSTGIALLELHLFCIQIGLS
jgi:hypothetical protein